MSFLSAYLNGHLSDFFALSPLDTPSALELPRSSHRSALVAALGRYASSLNAPKETLKALQTLENPNAKVVVTGQQAGLLLGPNYTLSKAITAINLAKELSTEERPLVPIFWVASQDHDVEEVNHTYFLDMDETLHRIAVDLPHHVPVGKIPMQQTWLKQITQALNTHKTPEPYKDQVIKLLEETASISKTYADWFAAILYQLLGNQGLIILNPLEPDIAPLFKPIVENELENPDASSLTINQAGERLQSLGYEPQLKRAEQATNLFLEDHHKRQLLKFDGKMFINETGRYSLSDLKQRLNSDATLITPAAGLRPITQDSILPTAITVLGPGELKYFAQLKGVYDLHKIAMPLCWPRATATILEPPVVRIMEKFGLELDQLTRDFAHTKSQKLLDLHGYGKRFLGTHQILETSLYSLTNSIKAIDPTLLGTLKRNEEHLRKTLDILKHKTTRALENQDTITTHQFDRLEAHLLPLNTPQERLISPFSFFLKFGIEAVIKQFATLPTTGDHAFKV